MEECTRAETGVGAAIAAGNQLEKGICALLVIAASIREMAVIKSYEDGENNIGFQCPCLISQAMEIRMRASPIRLVSAVIIPALKDLGFW